MGQMHWFNVAKSRFKMIRRRINMVRRRINVVRKRSTWSEEGSTWLEEGSTWLQEEGTSRKQAGLTEANPPLFEEETRPLKMPAGWPFSPALETTAKPDSHTPPITTPSTGPPTFAKPCAHQHKLLASYEHSKKQTLQHTRCVIP